jgi:hypothetical protein
MKFRNVIEFVGGTLLGSLFFSSAFAATCQDTILQSLLLRPQLEKIEVSDVQGNAEHSSGTASLSIGGFAWNRSPQKSTHNGKYKLNSNQIDRLAKMASDNDLSVDTVVDFFYQSEQYVFLHHYDLRAKLRVDLALENMENRLRSGLKLGRKLSTQARRVELNKDEIVNHLLKNIEFSDTWKKSGQPPFKVIYHLKKNQAEVLADLAISANLEAESITTLFTRTENYLRRNIFGDYGSEYRISRTIKVIIAMFAGGKIEGPRDLILTDMYVSDLRHIWEKTYRDNVQWSRRGPETVRTYLDTEQMIRLMEFKAIKGYSVQQMADIFQAPTTQNGKELWAYLGITP